MQCIYGIRNKVDSKIYIGQTKHLKRRWSTHSSYLKNKKHSNPYLQSAWTKYGENNFELVVLEIIEDFEKLTEREQYWMDHLCSQNPERGYNIEPASSGKSCSRQFSEEHKKRISESKLGKPRSLETVEKMRRAASGKKWTDSQREKMNQRYSGEKNPFAKLDWDKVRDIRSRHGLGETASSIAKSLGLHPSTVGLVVTNKTWIEN